MDAKSGFDLCIVIDLLNTGAKPEEKVRLPGSFEPELSLPLVQSSFAKRCLMKAKLWGNVDRKVYGLSSITCCCSAHHKRDFSKGEKRDCQSVFSSIQPHFPESVADAELRGELNRKVYGFLSMV
jgi:hypothetical protein